jgi:oligosaccharide repeat unit polymerase
MPAVPQNTRNNLEQSKWLPGIGWPLVVLGTFSIAIYLENPPIALLSCGVLLFSRRLARTTVDLFDMQRVTITSFWYLTYLAMIFLPAFFVFADQPGPYRAAYLLAVESVLLTVPLGWWLANAQFGYQKIEIEKYFRSPVADSDRTPLLYPRFKILILVAIGFTALYVKEVETIPLFYLIKNPGEYLQLALLREDSFKLLDSRFFYFYYVLRQFLYPFLIMVSLGFYLRTRQKKWLALFILCLVLGLFYNSLTLAKAPVAFIVLLVGIFVYLYRGGILNRKVIAVVLVLALAFPFAVILSVSSEDVGAQLAARGIGYRLFYLPAEIVYYYYEVFPSQVPYLHGRSINKLAAVLGLPYFDTTSYVGHYGYPIGLETVNANGAFIADLNADFGLLGVLLGGLLAGYLMQAMHIYLLRSRKTVSNIACYAFLVVAFWYLHSASLPIVLASNGTLLAFGVKWYLERGSMHMSEQTRGVAVVPQSQL